MVISIFENTFLACHRYGAFVKYINQNFWYIPAILIIQNVCSKKGGTFTCTCIACWCCYCYYWLIRMCDFIPSVACGYSWIKKNHSYCSKKEEYSTLHRPIRKNALCLIKKKTNWKIMLNLLPWFLITLHFSVAVQIWNYLTLKWIWLK